MAASDAGADVRSPTAFHRCTGLLGPRLRAGVGLTLALSSVTACGGTPNYDEALVPDYVLPDPLITASGDVVSEPSQWASIRRPEILTLFEEHVYGRTPPGPFPVSVSVDEEESQALDGAARRKQVTVRLRGEEAWPGIRVLVYLPAGAEGPVPVFLALNYYGNQSIHPDPAILLSDRWMRQNDDFGIVDNRATEASRGVRRSRWPVESILARGYGLVTAYYGDVDPDFDDGFRNGVHAVLDQEGTERDASAWGSIGAWAWGLSRIMDYLATDPDVDAGRVAVMGHSRLGKTALWAGAQDERFAMVISNDSGAGGAALSRRRFGETVRAINEGFPHWFNDRFTEYDGREDQLPVDQHMLLSLIAPRPLYVASAVEDRWADPRGEFLSLHHAAPVYGLFEALAFPTEWPEVGVPAVEGRLGYHVRPGVHDVTEYDWERFMDFADEVLGP